MDECLNDDDDEEHHRVFSDCFGALHEQLFAPAGRGKRVPESVPDLLAACRITAGKPGRTLLKPEPSQANGRSTGR